MRLALIIVALSFLAGPASARAQARIAGYAVVITPTDSNIVYGNGANASLLMDVFRPSRPNGIGIIFISGSGWGGVPMFEHGYDDPPLRTGAQLDSPMAGILVRGLVARGYTVFSIDHRFAPEWPFPTPLYDAQRAVRFIRGNAARYGIDPQKLGAIGHSSGGHLAAMVGVKDTVITPIDNSKHQYQLDDQRFQLGSSQVQAVVTLAAPLVMSQVNVARPGPSRVVTNLLGTLPGTNGDGTIPMTNALAAASPVTFVTARSAPMLIYQAQDDSVVLKGAATLMAARLAEAKVPHKLRMRPSGGHEPAYDLNEIDAWFRRFLKK
jgi:acetyl esterase/lipase